MKVALYRNEHQSKRKMTIYITRGANHRSITKLALPPEVKSECWKMEQGILSHHEGDRLLKIRFKLGHAARNLPMLIEHTCHSQVNTPIKIQQNKHKQGSRDELAF
jgi:hypothetical protein